MEGANFALHRAPVPPVPVSMVFLTGAARLQQFSF
jgi:hypothetical protein